MNQLMMKGILIGTALLMLSFTESDAKKTLSEAIKNIRETKGYRADFKTSLDAPPPSDTMRKNGYAIIVNPDILYLNFVGTGNMKVEMVMKERDGWRVHPATGEWLPLALDGEDDPELGLYDIDEVLNTLSQNLRNVKMLKPEKLDDKEYLCMEVLFDGKAMQTITADQELDTKSVVWEDSSLKATVWIGQDARMIHRMTIVGVFVTQQKHQPQQELSYKADVLFSAFNQSLDLPQVPSNVKDKLKILQ